MIITCLRIDPNTVWTIAAVVVAVMSFLVAMGAMVKQAQTFLINFVSTRAEHVNNYLNSGCFVPKEPERFSALVSNIVTTEEALQVLQNRFRIAHCLIKRRLLDIFFLSLHTSVREWLQNPGKDPHYTERFTSKEKPVIEKQIETAREFLRGPLRRYPGAK